MQQILSNVVLTPVDTPLIEPTWKHASDLDTCEMYNRALTTLICVFREFSISGKDASGKVQDKDLKRLWDPYWQSKKGQGWLGEKGVCWQVDESCRPLWMRSKANLDTRQFMEELATNAGLPAKPKRVFELFYDAEKSRDFSDSAE